MKAIVPEIAWHNKSPVFSVDIQPEINKSFYRAATGGGDSHIVIWHLVIKEVENETTVSVDFAADLDRHIKAVNVVRFSNDSKLLASGDDDAVIIIWALKEGQNICNNSSNNEEGNKENWCSVKVLRGHKDDVYDICWSPSSNELFSGSVDNTANLWNVNKGQSIGKVGEHNGFVQGVAWDPKNKYLATLCSDRGFRLFDVETKKIAAKVTKAKINRVSVQEEADTDENLMRLFHDDTVKTFFRRLCFSPDGNLVFVPCGIFQEVEAEVKPPKDVTYVFLKSKPERPVFHLPSRDEYTVVVRCCPILFELNPFESTLFKLPYRMIFAIASRKSIVFYDTQQLQPFGIVSDIHYATLTDITWSPDGRLLLASSSDGYCTIITFKKGELGVPYKESSTGIVNLNDQLGDLGVAPLDQSGFQKLNGSVTTLEVRKSKLKKSNKTETSLQKPSLKPTISTEQTNGESTKEQPMDLDTPKKPNSSKTELAATPNRQLMDVDTPSHPNNSTTELKPDNADSNKKPNDSLTEMPEGVHPNDSNLPNGQPMDVDDPNDGLTEVKSDSNETPNDSLTVSENAGGKNETYNSKIDRINPPNGQTTEVDAPKSEEQEKERGSE